MYYYGIWEVAYIFHISRAFLKALFNMGFVSMPIIPNVRVPHKAQIYETFFLNYIFGKFKLSTIKVHPFKFFWVTKNEIQVSNNKPRDLQSHFGNLENLPALLLELVGG